MKDNKELFEKHNYLNKKVKYIKNAIIIEYDMKNAGPSILKHEGLISDKDFERLMKLDKQKRSVTVGKFLRENPKISKELMQGFVNAREEFFEENNISKEDVLSIKKDAIFLINSIPEVTQLNEDYLFRPKNEYSSYISLREKEFYYSLDNDILDIKGFGSEIVESHKNYLFKFVKECLKLDADGLTDELFVRLLTFKNDFIERKLNNNYYKDISTNTFLYRKKDLGIILSMKYLNDNLKNNKYLCIDNNLNFILELISNLLG